MSLFKNLADIITKPVEATAEALDSLISGDSNNTKYSIVMEIKGEKARLHRLNKKQFEEAYTELKKKGLEFKVIKEET